MQTASEALFQFVGTNAEPAWNAVKWLVTGFLPVALVPGGLWLLLREVYSKRVEIMPLTVPPSLVELGFSGEVLARQLRDAMEAIQHSWGTSVRRAELALGAEAVDISVPGVGLSLTAVVQIGRRLARQPSRRVSGEALRPEKDGPVVLHLRFGAAPAVVVAPQPATVAGMDAALKEAARGMLERVSPFNLLSHDYVVDDDSAKLLARAQKLARETPDLETRVRALNLQGLIYQKELRNPAEAERCYREAIRLDRRFALAYNNLGNLLSDLGRRDEAERSFREAIRIDPNNAAAHYNLGNLLRDLGRRDEAERSFREAIRIDPNNALAHNNLGALLRDLGRRDEAERSYREAIRIDPNYAAAHFNLALLLEAAGRLPEALAEAEKAARLAPEDARFSALVAHLRAAQQPPPAP